jgi:hypothetical protein
MTIYRDDSEIVYRVATRFGEKRTSKTAILRPGSYSMHVHWAAPPGLAVPHMQLSARPFSSFMGGSLMALSYHLEGIGLSDPTGPELVDPSEDPFPPCQKGSDDHCYPGDRMSPDPFIVVDVDEIELPPETPDDPGWVDPNLWYWATDWLSSNP